LPAGAGDGLNHPLVDDYLVATPSSETSPAALLSCPRWRA
jgi:hypothetical protein